MHAVPLNSSFYAHLLPLSLTTGYPKEPAGQVTVTRFSLVLDSELVKISCCLALEAAQKKETFGQSARRERSPSEPGRLVAVQPVPSQKLVARMIYSIHHM